MEKSGTRYPGLKKPIIERGDLPQPPRQKLLYGALTLGFWLFWLYLWLPLIALLAWTLGLQQAYKYMIVLGGLHEVFRLLALYGLVIALLGGSLLAWALYNIYRFTGVERRVTNPPITALEIARDFGMDPLSVRAWQVARSLRATHDQEGRIVRVEILKV